MATLLSGLWLSWRLSGEKVPILFSVIARLSLCLSLARCFYVSRPPSLSLVGALMLDDSLSWALSVEPCAPSAFRSPSVSFTVCISVSFEDHFYPTYFLLHAHKPPTPQTFQLFSLSFPFFLSPSALSVSFGCIYLSFDALTSSFLTQTGFLRRTIQGMPPTNSLTMSCSFWNTPKTPMSAWGSKSPRWWQV